MQDSFNSVKLVESEFLNPGADFRPQPFWFLNHHFSKEELERQIDEMHAKGVGGAVLHSRHGKSEEYLSPEYLEILEFCTEECRKRGMVVWLYDEDNWPSGTLGGKLTRENPDYRMRYLRVEERKIIKSAEPILLDFKEREHNTLITILAYPILEDDGQSIRLDDKPLDLTDRLNSMWTPPTDADYIILAFWECEIAEKVTFGSGYYLDTMNPEAVNAFITHAYEPFLHLQPHFGKTIQGVFTDEPGLMIHDGFFGVEAIRTEVKQLNANLPGYIFAWTRDFLERFHKEKGYDLKPWLGALLYQIGEKSRSIREDYYQKVTDWYVNAYHHAIHSWCQKHDLKYIGHTLEEPLWGQARSQGNQTKVLQQFDYPGLDYLTPGIGTKENPHRILSVKCAASVAHLEGKKRVICEAFGASDHGYSMRQRKLDANFMAFLGVNLFIPHAYYYSFAGYRKTDFPPTEFYHSPHWEHYRAFADYIGRLSLMGTVGRHDANILLVSPIHTIYQTMFENGKANMRPESDTLFSLLSDRLLRNRLVYDYVDESQLVDGIVLDDGKLTFPNADEKFSFIILPGMEAISEKTAEKLQDFVKMGGQLIIIGNAPSHSHYISEDRSIQQVFSELIPADQSGVWYKYEKGKVIQFQKESVLEDDANLICNEIQNSLQEGEKHSWHIPEENNEDIIMTRRIMGEKTFTWIMNWSEKTAIIRYQSQESVEEWDLETGIVKTLSYDELEQFTLYPGQLRIVANVNNDKMTVNSSSQIEKTIDLPKIWNFQLDDPNVFILDKWEVTLNDRKSRANATMPGQTNTYRTRFHVDQDLLDYIEVKKEKIHLITDDLEQEIPSHIGFLSRRRDLEVFVNGKRLPALEPASWQDPFYKSVEITPYLIKGENVIEILTISLLEPMQGLHYPAFLVGNFSTTLLGELFKPRETIAKSWTEQGYPYFSGKATFSQDINLDKMFGEDWRRSDISVWLQVEDIKETALVWLNDEPVGIKLWPPYAWDLTKSIQNGQNQLRIQVANTLENLYGKNPIPSGLVGKAKLVLKSDK